MTGLNLISPRKGVAHRLRTHNRKRESSLFVRALIRLRPEEKKRREKNKTTPGIEHLVNVQYRLYASIGRHFFFFIPSMETFSRVWKRITVKRRSEKKKKNTPTKSPLFGNALDKRLKFHFYFSMEVSEAETDKKISHVF